MPPKQDQLRERVYKFYSDNIAAGKGYTRTHFMKEGVSERTLNAILQRFHNNLPASHQRGGGRPAKIFTPNKIRALKRKFDHKDGISQRQGVKKFQCSPAMINKTLKKLIISCRKKKTIPDRNERQKSDAKILCDRLSNFRFRALILFGVNIFAGLPPPRWCEADTPSFMK
uniref:Uncharacterized protein n=1 Tax=Acrobeloides nanus TaxID=290746 RepID=A0A914EDP4_9BILA